MKSLIESLSSPHIVAHFQRVCGVQWIYPNLPNEPMKDEFMIRNRFLYRAMRFGSQLADETFFHLFLSGCSLMLDVSIARKVLIKLALGMYIGQAVKDILRQPRPAAPPCIRLETKFETEYGMPSTHTVTATISSFALYMFSKQLYQIPERKCFLAASVWTAWVATSRVYLGMHTFLQVIVGSVGPGILMYNFSSTIDKFDQELVQSNLLTGGVVVASALLTYLIFRLDSGLDPVTGKPRWNSARGDQAEIMGFCTGFLVGSRWAIEQNLHQYRIPGNSLLPLPTLDWKSCLLRLIVGGIIAVPIVFIAEKFFLHFFAKIGNVSLDDKEAAKRNPKLELPYKFTSCIFSGILCTTAIPWILNELNLW